MDDTLQFAINIAKEAGQLLRKYFRVDGVKAELKPDHSLVTQADLEADDYIQKSIRKKYPQDGLLTEETCTAYPGDSSSVWIVDPLDGTTNFSLGLHYWGVSIARFQEGMPHTAAVYFPIVDELFAAQRGNGATLNGMPHQVPPPEENSPSSFFAHCSRTCHRYQVTIPYKRRSLGAAAYHLCTVAKGSAIIALETTPKIWDIAGAWLVVEECGGSITTLEGGQPFPAQPGMEYLDKPFTTLAAANTSLLQQAEEGLIPKTTFSY